MLRSEDMSLCDVYINTEAGFNVMQHIGELECVQFIDMNRAVAPVDRHYVPDVLRCTDIEKNLNYIKEEITKEGIQISRLRDLSHISPLNPTEMLEFENMIDSWTKDIKDMSANHTNLKKLKSETKEIYYVIHHLDPILGNVEMGNTKLPRPMGQSGSAFDRRQLKIITGTVERSTSYQFQTMLWRISHGNIYYTEASHDESFQNAISGRKVRKVAFVIICYGDELHQRILKVCNGFNVNLYRWPETHDDRVATLGELPSRMKEMDKVLQKTKNQRAAIFRNIAAEWETWMTQVLKAKAIYHQLNLFNMDISNNTLIGQCWVSDRNYDQVESRVESTSEKMGARSFMVKTVTDDIPPTCYRTNKFTSSFQAIIGSYQIGRYKELNPGFFAIVTFPFLFGVMFGDVGHGFLLLLYAFWMINNEEKYKYRTSTNEVWYIFFKGRYMILMMGLFAIYMGFLYNEWFSLSTKMMSAFWLNTYDTVAINDNEDESWEIIPQKGTVGYAYKYGIDPGIKLAQDGLRIESSVKMKLAIILGTAQVVFGLLLSMWNYLYFRKYYQVFLLFLPKLLFVLCIFGFLIFLILHKWYYPLLYPEVKELGKNNPDHQSVYDMYSKYDFRKDIPDLRDEFLHFVLWAKRRDVPLLKTYKYILLIEPKQLRRMDTYKVILYHIALTCFPVMLLGPPIYLYVKNRIQIHKMERKRSYSQMSVQESEELKKRQEFKLGGIFLHRLWRTMEFGLAIVSHMASYLRLWALSLAHTLLTDFLWHMTLRKLAFNDRTKNGIWKLYLVFFLWVLITLFFLVIMDSLAVFIHALRLHWIEFMSKFFKGDGVPFKPFTLSTVLDERDIKREEETATFRRIRRAREEDENY